MLRLFVKRSFSLTAFVRGEASNEMRTLYIKNLSYKLNNESLRDEIEQKGFKVTNTKLILDRETGRSRGFGFVEFADSSEAKRALDSLLDDTLDGRQVVADYASQQGDFSNGNDRPRSSSGYRRDDRDDPRDRNKSQRYERVQRSLEPAEPSDTLYIGNLNFACTEDYIRSRLSVDGCLEVNVIMGKDGRKRGFAFAKFESVEAASAAVKELDGMDLEGRPITANFRASKEVQ